MDQQSLSAVHRATAARFGPATAVRHRRHGVFVDVSWDRYRLDADAAATGLLNLDVQAGDRIAILSENCYPWLAVDLAIQAIGGITVPMHAPLSSKQVAYQLGHSGAVGVVVSGSQQLAKIIAAADSLSDLRFIVSFESVDAAGRWPVVSWDQLRHAHGVDAAAVCRREQSIAPADLSTILYTSGTTGNPKGVMLSHANILFASEAALANLDIAPGDLALNWLPLSHIFGRVVDHHLPIRVGATLCLAGSVETLLEDLRRLRPMLFASVPRFFEKIWQKIEPLPSEHHQPAIASIFGSRIATITSGGAVLPRHVGKGFAEAGYSLREGYGMTETAAIISMQQEAEVVLGSVGKPLPGTDVQIAEDGEILIHGAHVMCGYWRDPDATEATMVDGWLHTGDIGRLEEGNLYITGRKKDLFVTSSGKNVAPAVLEQLMVSDPLIDQAMAIGDGRHYLTALIIPTFEKLEAWSDDLSSFEPDEDGFVRSESCLAFFQKRIDERMEEVSKPERVRKILVFGRPLSLDADEITITMKVRRTHLCQKFSNQIESLYAELDDSVAT
jgi:long-chain acyl-CoA synthetase